MKILIVDDNPIMRAGLNAMLRGIEEIEDVVEASNGPEALDLLADPGPVPIDLVFLDIRMPGMNGLAVLEQIDDVPVVMLTNADDSETISAALSRGAKGYLVNGEFTGVELAATVRMCANGGMMLSPTAAARVSGVEPESHDRFGLTTRERALVEALAEGLSNRQIARQLELSEHTVKNHLNRMYAKMGVTSRSEAIVAWLREQHGSQS